MAVSENTPAPLQSALQQVRLDGAIFFRSEFSEAWAYESPEPTIVCSILRPDASRLLMFHIVAAGRCWIALADGERHWASRGDVIVIPYGDQHWVGGETPTDPVPILDLFDAPPWDTMPVLRYGAGGERTDIVCGYLHSEDPLFNPAMGALPPLFVVRPEGPAAQWVESSIQFALASTTPDRPAELDSTRLPELLLIEILRIHLASAPAAERGWIAALRDPVLAPAMAAMHADPSRKWTVADLATTCLVSRSLLDERFRAMLGRSPIRYLADWRMHIAEELLATTELSVAAVARRVGYDAEEAFSRAFKRAHGEAPSVWRAARA